MADFETNDIIRLGGVCRFDGAIDIVNTFHVMIVAGGPMAFAQASQDFVEYMDTLMDYVDAVQSTLITDDYISIKNVSQSTVWGSVAWNAYTGGADAGAATAPQVACLGFARTMLSRVQIRKYFGVFTQGDITDGEWLSAVTTPVYNAMGWHIQQQVMTQGLTLLGVAWSDLYTRATVALSPAASPTCVIQRRRRRGRGS